MYTNMDEHLADAFRNISALDRAETVEEINESFRKAINGLQKMATDRYDAIFEGIKREANTEVFEHRIRAQGGE